VRLKWLRWLRGRRPVWELRFAGQVSGSETRVRLLIDRASGAPSYRVLFADHGKTREIWPPQLVGVCIIEDIENGSGLVVIEQRGERFIPWVVLPMHPMGTTKTLEMDLHTAAAEMLTEQYRRVRREGIHA
jgi:hypothetical protein